MGKCVKEEKWRVRNYETRGKDKVRGRGKKIFTRREAGGGGKYRTWNSEAEDRRKRREMHGKTMMRKSNEKGRKESQG